jgi:putative nucleotidyltransferase with HDIG domain
MKNNLPIENKAKKRIIRPPAIVSEVTIEPQKEEKSSLSIPIENKMVLKVAELANKYNFKVFIVGGFVRDYYLNRQRADLDFTVIGDALEFAKIVAKHFKTKPVLYERFKTAMVPLNNELQLEFVGTRSEEYEENSRKPIVSEGTLEDDLLRRDFTINALAVSLQNDEMGKVIDLFNGYQDIEKKILRTPLDPYKTFEDDPLRMIRAARFASQLGFTIEGKTIRAIKSMKNRLKIISMERISSEFLKILASPKPSVGINILNDTELLPLFLPEITNLKGVEIKQAGEKNFAHKDVYKHSLMVLDNISNYTEDVYLRFAALLHDVGKPITKRFQPGIGWSFHGHEEVGANMIERIFRRLKLPLEKVPYIETLVRLHQRPMMLVDDIITDSAIRRLAVNAGEYLQDLFTLCKADITTKNPNLTVQYLNNYDVVLAKVLDVQEKDKLREFQSPVRGEEIMEYCSLAPCKAIGIIKNNIEEAILEGIIPNEYQPARAYFEKNVDYWISLINPIDIRKK